MKRALIAALAALGLIVGLAACQKVTKSVTTSISPCFRVLPQAREAVGKQGSIVDIARLRGEAVTVFDRALRGATTPGIPPSSPAPPSSEPGTAPDAVAGRRDVCVVAFRGTFDPSRVQHLVRSETGRYAIVTVGSLTQRVRLVVLTDQLPPPLHAHRGLPS
jgi:hypothetical protein